MPRGNDRRGVWACVRKRRARRPPDDHGQEGRHARRRATTRANGYANSTGLDGAVFEWATYPASPPNADPRLWTDRLHQRPDLDRPLHDQPPAPARAAPASRQRARRGAREDRTGRLGRRADVIAQLQRRLERRLARSASTSPTSRFQQRHQPDRASVPGWQLLRRERRHEQRRRQRAGAGVAAVHRRQGQPDAAAGLRPRR